MNDIDLTGYIVHHLATSISNDDGGLNESNCTHTAAGDTPKSTNKRPRAEESPPAQSRTRNVELSPIGITLKDGFFFRPSAHTPLMTNHAEDKESELCEIQLIFPQAAVWFIIDAARFNLLVTVKAKSYSILKNNTSISVRVSRQTNEFIMELCRDSITFHGNRQNLDETDSYTCRSLEQFQAEEMQMEADRKKRSKSDAKDVKKEEKLFSIKGTIDAVSPILGMSSNDPFSLIELYDKENDPSLTATVVIKGSNALSCLPGLQPDFNVSFMNVKRQRWHVPQSFQSGNSEHEVPKRLFNRVPSHVFVVTDPKCVHWNDDPHHEIPFEKNGTDDQKETSISVPLPTTVWPLTSVQGRVVSVNYILERNRDKIIHYLLIMPLGRGAIPIKLYLTYYPVSSLLSIGLRKGAYITAINVHKLNNPVLSGMRTEPLRISECRDMSSYLCYGACVRSTVSLIASPSECAFSFMHEPHQFSETSSATPHVFRQRKESYSEIEWISCCRKLFSKSCKNVDDLTVERTLKKLLAANGSSKKGGRLRRDPYKEWFDHACDAILDKDGKNEPETCFCEPSIQDVGVKPLPYVIGLDHLRQICMSEIEEAFEEHCKSEESTCNEWVGVGSTASIHLPTSRLQHLLGITSDSDVYTGGFVRDIDANGHVVKIGTDFCWLPFSLCIPDNDSESSREIHLSLHEKGTFILTKVRSAIASCVYLGRDGSMMDCDFSKNRDRIKLPTVNPDCNRNSFEGPSMIISIGCHYYAVSMQVQYILGDEISLARKQKRNLTTDDFISKGSGVFQGNMIGRVSRQRWKIPVQKETQEYYDCCITVSYSTISVQRTSYPCHMPRTIDIILKIPCNLAFYVNHVSSNRLHFLSKRVCALMSAWQYIAESRFAPLVSGGWNERQKHHLRNHLELDEVKIKLPLSDDDRAPIDVDSISLAFSEIRHTQESLKCFPTRDNSCFHYCGGHRMFRGMLDNRLQRSINLSCRESYKIYCEALLPPYLICGLPDVSISTLLFMKSLASASTERLCMINNASVSKVRFCRARAECTRCYKTLVNKTCVQQSFWDRPLPIGSSLKKASTLKKTSHNHSLICPSGCNKRHAYIKWELSGILKDSTGTAKLYTERETATLLLGKDINIRLIEEAAWNCANGITYQAGLPLPMDLKVDLRKQKSEAAKFRGIGPPPEPKLSREFRACYEMYKHCSLSSFVHRQMNFLCELKPPKRKSQLTNSTEISLVSTFGNEQGVIKSNDTSMIMPFLELRLIDCFRDNNESNNVGWSMANAMLL